MMEATRQSPGAGQMPPSVTSDEQAWAAIAHASAVVTVLFGVLTGGALCLVGPIVPLAIWLVFRSKSPFVAQHALQATIFQTLVIVLTAALFAVGLILVAVAWVGTGLLMSAVVGICLIPVALVLTLLWIMATLGLPVAALVYACYGAYEVLQGRDFRYYLVGNWAS